MNYDTWKSTDTTDYGPDLREPEPDPCLPCGTTGLDVEGYNNRGVMLKKCDECDGAGWV